MEGKWLFILTAAVVAGFVLLGCSVYSRRSEGSKPTYLNPNQPTDKRVRDLLSRMTLEEKVSQMENNSPAIERLGISQYRWWNECVHGVCADDVTVFPHAIAMASTWDTDLIYKVATAISDEARALANKEANRKFLTFWSPVVNIGRDPRWGRTQEGYGEDPYLVSRIGVAFVKGLQGNHPRYLKVVSTPKHFAVNNEEWRRHTGSADVDEQLLREYYLPHFKACIVEGKAYSVMGAYNALNGIPCCANKELLTDILRGEWGFEGYVVSDCGAIGDIYANHHYVATAEEAAALAVKAGCDLNCGRVYRSSLVEAVNKGLLSEQDIDKALGRLLKARFCLGMFDPPGRVPYTGIPPEVVDCDEHRELARQTSRESMVLLKNADSFLPLDKTKIKSIAVIGPSADVCQFGNYSGSPTRAVTPLDGIRHKVSSEVRVGFAEGCGLPHRIRPIPSEYLIPAGGREGQHGLKGEYFDNKDLSGSPVLVRTDKMVRFEWSSRAPDKRVPADNFSVRWTGKLRSPVSQACKLCVTTDDGVRLYIDDKLVIDDWHDHGPTTNSATLKMNQGQEYDIRMEYYEHGGGAAVLLGWELESEREIAIEEAVNLAGKSDVAIVVVGTNLQIEGEGRDRKDLDLPGAQKEMIKRIYKVNPRTVVVLINGSPLSINWMKENIPAIVEAWYPGEEGGTAIADVLFGDYNPAGRLPMTFYKSVDQLPPFDDYDIRKGRTYMYLKEEPLFAFGHGLSYTKFNYTDFQISPAKIQPKGEVNISVKVQNVGGCQGDEVVQLYVRDVKASVKRPIKELKGFKRINLKPGEKKKVTFTLSAKELSFYDVEKKKFVVEPGTFEAMVGGSSRDIRLKGSFEVK